MRTGVPERPLQIEHADLSLLGNREENQDRVAIALAEGAAFLAVVDGMGGHADGARAAEVAIRTMVGRGNTFSVQAGAGIVADSNPSTEFQETVNKASAMLRAIDVAEQNQ